jgi:hypothetical protein
MDTVDDKGNLPAGKAVVFWMEYTGDKPTATNGKTHVIKWSDAVSSGRNNMGEKWDHVRYRKNDHAHCEQKNWTHVRQLFGHDRVGHPELVALMNDLYAQEWSPFTNYFKSTFKLVKREKQDGKTKRFYEQQPQTPDQRLLASPHIPEAKKAKLRAKHARLDPFA